MKVVIAGGRDFKDRELAELKIREMISFYNMKPENTEFISGKARGADTVGENIVRKMGYNVLEFPAEWDRYGKSAGFIRNRQMGKIATHALIFWDGKSRGTANMIKISGEYSLVLNVVRY